MGPHIQRYKVSEVSEDKLQVREISFFTYCALQVERIKSYLYPSDQLSGPRRPDLEETEARLLLKSIDLNGDQD